MLSLRSQQATIQARTTAAKPVAPRVVRCHAVQKQDGAAQQEEAVESRRPVLMAGLMAMMAPIVVPLARADEGADKRKAEKARRKAILAASRAKAEADLAAPKPDGRQEADDKVDAANAERQRLAAERIAAVKDQRDAEYAKQADRAVKEVPPV